MQNFQEQASPNIIDQHLLSLLTVLNAVILEQGITVNPQFYWWLLITVPSLLYTAFKYKEREKNGRHVDE